MVLGFNGKDICAKLDFHDAFIISKMQTNSFSLRDNLAAEEIISHNIYHALGNGFYEISRLDWGLIYLNQKYKRLLKSQAPYGVFFVSRSSKLATCA